MALPLIMRPVWTRFVANACSSMTLWFTERTAVTCSMSLAVRGRCSQRRTPEAEVSMEG